MIQRLDEEIKDSDNGGIVDLLDVIKDHLKEANKEKEVLGVGMAFVGLLHIMAEKSKESKSSSILYRH